MVWSILEMCDQMVVLATMLAGIPNAAMMLVACTIQPIQTGMPCKAVEPESAKQCVVDQHEHCEVDSDHEVDSDYEHEVNDFFQLELDEQQLAQAVQLVGERCSDRAKWEEAGHLQAFVEVFTQLYSQTGQTGQTANLPDQLAKQQNIQMLLFEGCFEALVRDSLDAGTWAMFSMMSIEFVPNDPTRRGMHGLFSSILANPVHDWLGDAGKVTLRRLSRMRVLVDQKTVPVFAELGMEFAIQVVNKRLDSLEARKAARSPDGSYDSSDNSDSSDSDSSDGDDIHASITRFRLDRYREQKSAKRQFKSEDDADDIELIENAVAVVSKAIQLAVNPQAIVDKFVLLRGNDVFVRILKHEPTEHDNSSRLLDDTCDLLMQTACDEHVKPHCDLLVQLMMHRTSTGRFAQQLGNRSKAGQLLLVMLDTMPPSILAKYLVDTAKKIVDWSWDDTIRAVGLARTIITGMKRFAAKNCTCKALLASGACDVVPKMMRLQPASRKVWKDVKEEAAQLLRVLRDEQSDSDSVGAAGSEQSTHSGGDKKRTKVE